MVHVKIGGEFYYFQLSLIYLLFTSFTIFFFLSPVSICIFQSGTRVKIDSPLSYIVREDQALSNQSFFIQPSTQCTSVKNKQNERFYLQFRLFLLHLDVHYNILNYTILKENKIHQYLKLIILFLRKRLAISRIPRNKPSILKFNLVIFAPLV